MLMTKTNKSYYRGAGIIFSVGYYIVLKGTINFHDNGATAMYLTYTEVEFSSSVNVTFSKNRGFRGGAICMLGFAALIFNDNITVRFENNSAATAGGAIYQDSITERDYFASRSCFFRQNGSGQNIKISFKGNFLLNTARHFGRSIHATNLNPCIRFCKNTSMNGLEIFSKCIGNFSFEDEENVTQISASGYEVVMNESYISAVPGKKMNLPIRTLDYLDQEVFTVYQVKLMDNSSSVTFEPKYMSDLSITFYGKPGDEADVVLESIPPSNIVYIFRVKMLQCPPGFFPEDKQCVCPSETPPSIQNCNDKTFQVILHHNYWISYENGSGDLLYGLCPFTNCLHSSGNTLQSRTLPQDKSLIENETCDEQYHGTLCSLCREGYALQYNDYYYSCRTKDSCKWGWLLYIVLEIIPVTIFFVVVMVFNIQFTDGALNGVIFFIQISDTMLIKANGIIRFQSTTYTGLEVYRGLSRIFNLNFFSVDQNEDFSFCLWESASTLDLLLFKYVSILYASTLVVVIIAVFRNCHSKIMNSILVRMKGRSAASTKSTIIHGVSGFLVICYSECARISFLLITPGNLYSEKNNTFIKKVALHNGEMLFFRGMHLFYALPALVIIIALGILPPLMLISYPLCYKVLAFFKIGETRFTQLLCTFIPLEKFKPFFDSFQSSFKDEYRFFSGLYFLYRFITLATFAFSHTTSDYYMIVQVQFAVIFAVHIICQPYKKCSHNILDSLLFLNLSLVNVITYFNFQYAIGSLFDRRHVNIASTLQVILLYLPLAYTAIYAAMNVIKKTNVLKLGSKALSVIPRVNKMTLNEPKDYHRLENRWSLSIIEPRKLD